jgi:hypothetical protein
MSNVAIRSFNVSYFGENRTDMWFQQIVNWNSSNNNMTWIINPADVNNHSLVHTSFCWILVDSSSNIIVGAASIQGPSFHQTSSNGSPRFVLDPQKSQSIPRVSHLWLFITLVLLSAWFI